MNITKFALIGGDLRIVELAKLLSQSGIKVYTYGLEKSEEIKNDKNISICNDLEQAVNQCENIISSIPFSNDGIEVKALYTDNQILIEQLISQISNKTLIAGSIKQDVYNMAKVRNVKVIDIMEQEELAVLNAISTAEGAIEIAMKNTTKVLHKSNVLIIGFGRISKVLAKKLVGLDCNVTCTARKCEDLAWIEAYGYKGIYTNDLKQNLSEYDLIINTVPSLILDKENLDFIKKDCLLIDLASVPGGIDTSEAKKKNLKFIWALALPGKVAPVSSAKYIKDTIFNILNKN